MLMYVVCSRISVVCFSLAEAVELGGSKRDQAKPGDVSVQFVGRDSPSQQPVPHNLCRNSAGTPTDIRWDNF